VNPDDLAHALLAAALVVIAGAAVVSFALAVYHLVAAMLSELPNTRSPPAKPDSADAPPRSQSTREIDPTHTNPHGDQPWQTSS
jgi:hypothetical protein